MKVTKIKYVDMGDGTIKITGFENVATTEEIEVEFGMDALGVYLVSGVPYYYRSARNIGCVYVRRDHNGSGLFELNIGDIIPGAKFTNIISTMKAAAKRLIRIRKEAKEKLVEKVIEI